MFVDFKSILAATCKAKPSRIVFSDAYDSRMLEAAAYLLGESLMSEIHLIGQASDCRSIAGFSKVASNDRIFWHKPDDSSDEGRQRFAAQLVASGTAHAALGGNIATTAAVIRAGIKGIGLADGIKTVSGSFIMHHPQSKETYLFADCGVVVQPTAEQLIDIAKESVKTWEALTGHPAKVAFLSFSTKGSATHERQNFMEKAAAEFKKQCPEVISDGELQFDAAISPEIAGRKAPGSPLSGHANCFIFPSLEAGNIAYKITQRLAGYEAYGPILQGLKKPFSDLSRGSTIDDIIQSAMIAVLRAS